MLFSNILGQDYIKNHLTRSVDNGRIPHAQLFVGPEGCGTLPMAIAYAQYILCNNTDGENNSGNETCNLKVFRILIYILLFLLLLTTELKAILFLIILWKSGDSF